MQLNILNSKNVKCFNVCEGVELVERNKDGPLPSPAVPWIVSACENPDKKMK